MAELCRLNPSEIQPEVSKTSQFQPKMVRHLRGELLQVVDKVWIHLYIGFDYNHKLVNILKSTKQKDDQCQLWVSLSIKVDWLKKAGLDVLLKGESNVERKNQVTSTYAKYRSTNNHQTEQKSAGGVQNTDSSYGLPHPISNMPKIRFAIGENETLKEKKSREFKEDLASWHHQFWLNHNEKFNKSKKSYLLKRENPNKRIDEKEHADDLSIFYKDFLDENFRTHFKYQREWYKKNFQVLWYGFQVEMEKLFKKIKG